MCQRGRIGRPDLVNSIKYLIKEIMPIKWNSFKKHTLDFLNPPQTGMSVKFSQPDKKKVHKKTITPIMFGGKDSILPVCLEQDKIFALTTSTQCLTRVSHQQDLKHN